MIGADSWLMTPDGIFLARQLEGRQTIWTGDQWATCTVELAGARDLTAITTLDGAGLLCGVGTQVRVGDEEDYGARYPHELGRLTPICATIVAAPSWSAQIRRRFPAYWLGYGWAAGRLESTGIQIRLRASPSCTVTELREQLELTRRARGWRIRKVRGGLLLLGDATRWLDETGLRTSLQHDQTVPTTCWLASARLRATFLAGVMEAGASYANRYWTFDARTRERAGQLHQLARSVGLTLWQVNPTTLKAPAWTLGMTTRLASPYPVGRELTTKPHAPMVVLEDHMSALEEWLIRSRGAVGCSRMLLSHGSKARLNPTALRAGTGLARLKTGQPAYDLLVPASARVLSEPRDAVRIVLDGATRWYSGSGLLVRDDFATP